MTKTSPLEVQEYLFADTAAAQAASYVESENKDWTSIEIRRRTRELLRLHRFTVMSWLMTNGVAIPVELVDDTAHPSVGKQYPDQPM